jgi:hypothetical protein
LKTTLTSILLLFLIFSTTTQAHIGSAGVVFEGQAGKYALQVYVQPPDVIPGTAKVTVLADGADITRIGISPIYFWFGDEGTPRSDEALPVKGETNRFEGQIWMMNSGATSVQVEIDGARGKGKLLVPVSATSTARRTMPAGLGWILAALGIFLIGVLTTIFGASVSDSLQPVGEKATAKTIRKRITGSLIGASFCGLFLFVGNNWWNNETETYKKNMFKPYTSTTKIIDQNILKLTVDSNSVNTRWLSYAIPDHGKLMHLFLIRKGSMDAFAHLHPVRIDTLNYQVTLPNLPTGKYLVFADIMRFNGFQYTISDSVEIKTPIKNTANSAKIGDPDDTYVITNSINAKSPNLPDQNITICGKPGLRTKLQDGSSIVWEEKPNKPLLAGQVYDLKFSVLSPDGKMADLQPYLGMMGHAAIVKDDGSVYIHLHPTGTVSTTAITVMEKRIGETTPTPVLLPTNVFKDSVDKVLAKIQTMPEAQRDKFLMPNMNHNAKEHHGGSVKFPYVFPTAGNYRIWLQIKRNEKVLTGVFDAVVI